MKRLAALCCALHALAAVLHSATPRPTNDGSSNTLLLAEREGSYEKQGGSGATAELGETNVAGAAAEHTVWYRYQAPVNGRFIVDLKDEQGLRAELRFPGNPAPTIPLQTFADGTSNTIAFDEERLSTDLDRGETVYLVVDAEKPFAFSWRFVEVVNDTYKDAETLTGPIGTVKRADLGAKRSAYEESIGISGPAIWFQWTASSTGNYNVDLLGSRERSSQHFGNYFLYIYESVNGAPGNLLVETTGDGLGIGTIAPFNAEAGKVYYFACHGFAAVPDNEIWLSWYPDGAERVFEWATPQTRVSEADGVAKAILLQLYREVGFGASFVTVSGIPAGPGSAATGGADYQTDNNPILFGPLDRHKMVEVSILPDAETEGLETFGLGLSSPSAGTSIRDGTSNTIYIGSEKTQGACGLVAREVSAREGALAWLEVRRLEPGTEQIAVGWSVSANGGAVLGEDLPAVSGTAYIGANELSTFIQIPIYQDGAFEGRESFSVTLSEKPLSGSITDGTSNTLVFIEDDDYFVPRTGRYCGVVEVGNWGALVKCALSNAGTATGTVDFQGVKYPFRGTFDAAGELVVPLQRGNRPPLGLRLRFGEGWNECDAAVRDPEGEWADGSVRLLPYDGKRVIAPQAGAYTVLCNGDGGVSTPFILTGTAKPNGTVQFLGKMADNTPVAFSGAIALGDGSVRAVNSPGECAFAAPLYGKKGNLYGTLELGLGPEQPGGESKQWWLKPWRASDTIYSALPFQTCLSTPVRYTPPPRGERVTDSFNFALGDGSARFLNGGTAVDGTSNTISISERNQVTAPANCSIKINAKNGTFSGKITPAGGAPTTFYGAFLQGPYGYGRGFYLGDGRAGDVLIEAN